MRIVANSSYNQFQQQRCSWISRKSGAVDQADSREVLIRRFGNGAPSPKVEQLIHTLIMNNVFNIATPCFSYNSFPLFLRALQQKTNMNNSSVNPFERQQQQQINIDKYAQEMVQTIRRLKQNKQKQSLCDRADISDHSFGSVYPLKSVAEKHGDIEGVKRDNPVKVVPLVGRKRIKANSEYQGTLNDDSQFIDSISNRKITEYYKIKNQLPQIPASKQNTKSIAALSDDNEQQVNSHPVIKSLRQKISRKEKTIEQMSTQVEKIREKYEKVQEEIKVKRENQMNVLISFMTQKYNQKIYKQKLEELRKQEHTCKMDKKILGDVMEKYELLKNEKSHRKSSKTARSINDETYFLEAYGEERQGYLNNWRKKLQSQKTTIQKQLQKVPICEEIEIIEESYYDLPSFFLDSNNNRTIFQKNYLPLYTRHDTDPVIQIRALNLSKLILQNLTILSYPKIARKQKRIQIKSHIKQIHTKSLHLSQQQAHSLFTNNTIFTQLQNISQQFLVLGRAVWQEDLPYINLKHMMKRYECIPENIAKYIIKVIIRGYERIRRQTNHECIIFPENIIFNQRNDIKIDNWILNQIYRFQQYAQYLSKDSRFLYLPPEYKIILYSEDMRNTGIGIWSIGVMLFQMIFGKKPFQYQKSVDHEEFFMMNQIQFPPKPQVAENCKQFIRLCLAKPQNRISFEKALKSSYLEFKK